MSDFNTSKLTSGQITALRDLDRLARTLGRDLMLIGATARLVQLDWVLALQPVRATLDVDVVIELSSWDEHAKIIGLATQQLFEWRREQAHRLRHRPTDTIVDLIPFGGLENPSGTLWWPSDNHEMTVSGLHEAEAAAGTLEIEPGLILRVVTLPFLVLLKLISWGDRRHSAKGKSDLQDADIVLRECIRLPKCEEASWEAYGALTDRDDIGELDFGAHAGAAVIGAHLNPLLSETTRARIRPILDELRKPYGPGIESLLPTRLDQDNESLRLLISRRYDILARLMG